MRRHLLTLVAGLSLVDCQGSTPLPDELSLLDAAGFRRMSPASTVQQESLGQLVPRQIVAIPRPDGVRYIMADPAGCGCLYVGNTQQLEAFQRLTRDQAIAVTFDQQSADRWTTVYGAAWGGDW